MPFPLAFACAERDVDLTERELALRGTPPRPGRPAASPRAATPAAAAASAAAAAAAEEEAQRLRETLRDLDRRAAEQEVELRDLRKHKAAAERAMRGAQAREEEEAAAARALREDAANLRSQLREARAQAARAEAALDAQAASGQAAEHAAAAAAGGASFPPFGDGDTYIPQAVFEDALEQALRRALASHLGGDAAAPAKKPSYPIPVSSTKSIVPLDPATGAVTHAVAPPQLQLQLPPPGEAEARLREEVSALTERLQKAEEMKNLFKEQLAIVEEAGSAKARQARCSAVSRLPSRSFDSLPCDA